jgi:hypothetical protein
MAPILAMTALFPLLPTWLDGAMLVGMRLPLIVLLLVIGSMHLALSRRAACCLALAVSLVFAAKIGIVLHQWRQYQDVLAETEVILEKLPRGAALLPVQSLGKDSPRGMLDLPMQRYWHLCSAAVLKRDAYIPYLFSGATVVAPHPARRSTSVVADTPVSPEALRRSAGLGHLDPEQARAYWRDWPREFDYVLWMHGAEAVDAEGLPLEPVARGRTVDLYRIVRRPS